MSADLMNPVFTDEHAAREYLESVRWPNGPVCPHCGDQDKGKKLGGKAHRPGLYRCGACKKQYTATVGTLFERSKIPLNKWLLACHLLCASKKGISAHQLHRMLGVTYKTAWFMAHRIREAFREGKAIMMGGDGGAVEVDETYFGNKPGVEKRRGYAHKHAIVTLVERGGDARSFHVKKVNAATLRPILNLQIKRDTMLMSDEAGVYTPLGKHFDHHFSVQHGIGEYVRGGAHTNTVEGYFSILKRGMKGTYQHCGEAHLKRYLAEFDFRYNRRGMTDWERAADALRGIEGKRRMYGGPDAR